MVLALQPKSARSARVNQPSPFPRAISLGRGTGTGRLGVTLAAGSLGSGCVGIGHQTSSLACAI